MKLCLHSSYIVQTFFHFDEIFFIKIKQDFFDILFETKSLSYRLSLVGTGTPQPDPKSGQVINENLSRSQPDLFASLSPTKAVIEAVEASKSSPQPLYANTSELKDEAEKVVVSKTSAIDLHQIETLKAENDRLRGQLSDYSKKIDRVGTLEQEMAKIHQAYQSLLKHSEKREMLEKSARAKLQAVIINLSDANKV